MRSEKIAALQAELRRLREEQDLDVDPSLLEEPEPAADSAPDMTAEAETGGADRDGADSTDSTDNTDAADQPAAAGDDDDAAPALGAPGQNGGGDGPSPDQGGGGDDRTATVHVELCYIFAGEASRPRKPDHNATVNYLFATRVKECRECCAPRRR